MRYRHEISSPLGTLRLFASDDSLTGLYFECHTPAPKQTDGKLDSSPFQQAVEQLEEYFAGERDEFSVATAFDGTEFQLQIWNALKEIPFGQTVMYRDIAESCGRPKAMRAVGAAVGRNPISVIVPCHRVVGAGGSLTGFAGGLDRKRWLLGRESALVDSLNGA